MNMCIAFNFHKLGYMNAPYFADASQVITQQINNHHIFSTVFLIRAEPL